MLYEIQVATLLPFSFHLDLPWLPSNINFALFLFTFSMQEIRLCTSNKYTTDILFSI